MSFFPSLIFEQKGLEGFEGLKGFTKHFSFNTLKEEDSLKMFLK